LPASPPQDYPFAEIYGTPDLLSHTYGAMRAERRSANALIALLTVFIIPRLAAPGPAHAAAQGHAARPNIVVIVADDLGWHDVGYQGSEIKTPHLDRLARSGVRLERHYVFPTCSPTRAAFLSGRNPRHFGILGPIDGRSTLALPAETLTLADVLKSRGYSTAIVGKWHLGLRPEVGPRRYGFNSSYGYFHGQVDPYTHLYKNGDRTWHGDDSLVDETGHATDLLGSAAVRWIETPHDGPFFLYLAFSVPHTPLQEEARWLQGYDDKIEAPSRKLFAAAVTHMDAAVGQVIDALGRNDLTENTLIIFFSDNGGQRDYASKTDYGGKYGPYNVLGNNKPLRGWKGELYEGGIRVPAFAYWPGKLAAREVQAPISVLDWLPTLAALTGFSPPAELKWEGADVWPQLIGKEPPRGRVFDWRTPQAAAVREGEWKLIEPVRGNGKPELFDLDADPLEATDLAERNPDRVAHLRALLHERQGTDAKRPVEAGK
jgi:arylsulfatase A-like enzyme